MTKQRAQFRWTTFRWHKKLSVVTAYLSQGAWNKRQLL